MKVLDAGRSLLQISAVNVSTGCCGCVSDWFGVHADVSVEKSEDQE